MKFLLLEDDERKREQVTDAITEFSPEAEIDSVTNWFDYANSVVAERYDLILLDLLVPRSPLDPLIEDHHLQLAETTRRFDSKSFRTPAMVLTRYLDQSEDFFAELNKVDINVIAFDDKAEWKNALKLKIAASEPIKQYSLVIICALAKEAAGFEAEVDSFGTLKVISGLLCREIRIGERTGVIVQASRMGLVTVAVTAALAIERFKPELVCMSGICGGVPGESSVYDVLISEICHQHDVGKWSDTGFKSEHYDVQIDAGVRNRLEIVCAPENYEGKLVDNLKAKKSEIPDDLEEIRAKPRIVVTSSGSAVMAEAGKTATLATNQRKIAGFDMEVFAVYEAARLAFDKPLFFAAKTVVDDGGKNKGDRFHRVGCLLSARVVVHAIHAILDDY